MSNTTITENIKTKDEELKPLYLQCQYIVEIGLALKKIMVDPMNLDKPKMRRLLATLKETIQKTDMSERAEKIVLVDGVVKGFIDKPDCTCRVCENIPCGKHPSCKCEVC